MRLYSRRLRDTGLPIRRTVPDVAALADSLHKHEGDYPPLVSAALVVWGVIPVPADPEV